MVNLNERLLTIANMIEKGETVADIGTDHGYLPIHLLLEEISPHVILTDISKGSLSKARENCDEYLIKNNYTLREGDGLETIEKGEVDVVVLAGIGGLLTIDILDWDLEKSHSFKKLILQPRNNGGQLRKYLSENEFLVQSYRIVPEGNRFAEIMNVVPGKAIQSKDLSLAEWEFPDEILSDVNPDAKDFLEKALSQEEIILNKILEGHQGNESSHAGEDIEYRKERIARISFLLSKV